MNALAPKQYLKLSSEEAESASEEGGWHTPSYRPTRRGSATVTGSELELGLFSITHEAWDARVHVSAGVPTGMIGFGVQANNKHECVGWGQELQLSQVAVVSSELDLILGAEAGFIATVIPEALIRNTAMKLGLDIDSAPDRSSGFANSEASRSLGKELRGLMTLSTNGKTSEEIESRLLSAVCLALSRPEENSDMIHPLQRHQVARRTRDYIDAHITQPLRLERLSVAVNANIRTIQRAFNVTFGMCPSHYIHAQRLRLARSHLKGANAHATTVTSVAHSCGFSHLGRFSLDYLQAFGEHPVSTLRG